MSPRPRKASDDDIFTATTRVMARCSPSELTLGLIAAEAGLTAGALVQRFGSKRALLLALSERFADGTDQLFAALRASSSSPLDALHAYGACMAGMGTSAAALANNLSWLQQDLTDPDFRRYTQIQARASRRELQRLIEEAIAQGEIASRVDPPQLARAIEVTVGGSLMAWAVHQEGSCRAWVKHDLDALLAPNVTRAGRAGGAGRLEGQERQEGQERLVGLVGASRGGSSGVRPDRPDQPDLPDPPALPGPCSIRSVYGEARQR